jgi:hypothetical protein
VFIENNDTNYTDDLDLFLKLAAWSQGIPAATSEEHGFHIPSVRLVQSRLQRITEIKSGSLVPSLISMDPSVGRLFFYPFWLHRVLTR